MHEMSGWTRPVPGSGRVLFPSDPIDGESLMGLVLRVASDNHHTSVSHLLASAGYPHSRAFDLAHARPERHRDLARVLGVSGASVKKLTHPEVRSGKALTTVRFLGAEVPSYDLVTRRRVSIETLRREPFHHAVWNHGLMPYCPLSLQLLLKACPVCAKPLDWYRAQGVHACGHSGCDADLRNHPTPFLHPDKAEAYRRMTALITSNLDSSARPELHPDLRGLDPGAVFELGWRLGRALVCGEASPRADAKRLPSDDIVTTLEQGDGILAGWPTSLPRGIQTALEIQGPTQATKILTRLRESASIKSGWPEIHRLLHNTHPDLLRPGRAALRGLRGTIVNGTAAQNRIGICASAFATVKRAAALETLAKTGERRAFHDFDAGVVEAFANAKRGSVRANVVSERLGLAFHGVEQLVCMNLLTEQPHPALQVINPGLRVTTASRDELLLRLLEARMEDVEDAIPLHLALKRLPGEKPWGPLVDALVRGRIRHRLRTGAGRLMRRIDIAGADSLILDALHFDRTDHPDFHFAADMTRRDVEEALNLNPGPLPTALAEELGRGAEAARLAVSVVQGLAASRISAAEICARWSSGSRRLPRELLSSRLQRTGAAGWNRFEVEAVLGARTTAKHLTYTDVSRRSATG